MFLRVGPLDRCIDTRPAFPLVRSCTKAPRGTFTDHRIGTPPVRARRLRADQLHRRPIAAHAASAAAARAASTAARTN